MRASFSFGLETQDASLRSVVYPIVVLPVFWIGVGLHAMQSDSQPPLPDVISYGQHIRPILSESCFTCHGPDEAANASGVRLDSFDAAIGGAQAIVPGDPDASALWQRVTSVDDPMPPADFRHPLSDQQQKLISEWIRQGAKYDQHWSYKPIVRPAVPKLKAQFSGLVQNPIDAFVFDRLEAEGIVPSPAADRKTLLRRLSLDLIGLPPTFEEVQDFVVDDSPHAYEKQVDRLLASPHYGERMVAGWLDLVRFSDTVGFHGDQNQRIFPYRDFVIRSLNQNQPFDEFTLWQIGGDLFPQPSEEQLVATGLLRLNMMTREGGAQPEEYLAKYTADRVRMVGTAWLGSTLGCCECHNHKYDPFTIEDFYSLGAFFDDIRQWGVYHSYGYTPNPDLASFTNDHPFPPELRSRSRSLDHQIRFLEKQLDASPRGSSPAASLSRRISRTGSSSWFTSIA